MNKDYMGRDQFQTLFDVSRETMERLDIYAAELTRWTEKINLVSHASLADLWRRHFADSAQLVRLAEEQSGLWADFGSGAGFPGLVVSALQPERPMVLVESDQRKAAFLASTSRKMGVDVRIESARIEAVAPLSAHIISARALANLDQLLQFAAIHRAAGAICLFLKGAQADSELTAARRNWHIDVERVTSLTDPNATILKIRDFNRDDA